jgi:lysophospholipase L1-like esterase
MSSSHTRKSFLSNLAIATAASLALGLLAPLSLKAQDLPVKTGETIAFLGDSITAGGVNTGGYCRLVVSGLEANGVKVNLIGAGISGHKSNQMLERLERDVLSKKPTWMTLSCGVNDVWHGAKGVPLDAYKKNITEIVEKAQAAGVKVMLLTATMINEDQGNENNQKLVAYNDFLRDLAKEKKCLLGDLNAEMQEVLKKAGPGVKGNYLTNDGVHMNPAGNEMMAVGVLKGFGLSGDQLAKAETAWLDTPKGCELTIKAPITLRQFKQFNAAAAKKGVSLQELTGAELAKALEAVAK